MCDPASVPLGATKLTSILTLYRTNITEPLRKYSSSRGDLTATFLLPQTPGATLQAEIDTFLADSRDRSYAGFNMLLLTPSWGAAEDSLTMDGAMLTNSGGGGAITARPLTDAERRCGGLSNGLTHPDADEWPKVQHGRQLFEHAVLDTDALPRDATEAEIVERLFALLT